MANQLYYYEDVVSHQLESNLQTRRRDLDNLLEEYGAGVSFDKSYIYFNAAPPAESLPKPRWLTKTSNGHAKLDAAKDSQLSLNNWIKASMPNTTPSTSQFRFPVPPKVLDNVNYSWPPFPKSIWSVERLKETTARERRLYRESGGGGYCSVKAFFKYFSEKQQTTQQHYKFRRQ